MKKLPAFPVEGGCLCGAVRYKLTEAPMGCYACHCKDCQRLSGGPFSLSMPIRRAALVMLRGTFEGQHKTADSGRTLTMMCCAKCRTILWNLPHATPDVAMLKPGTLDDLNWAVPIGNIWTQSKVAWVAIDAKQPNFEGQPPSRQPLLEAWARYMGLPPNPGGTSPI